MVNIAPRRWRGAATRVVPEHACLSEVRRNARQRVGVPQRQESNARWQLGLLLGAFVEPGKGLRPEMMHRRRRVSK